MSTQKWKRGDTVFATRYEQNVVFLGTEDGQGIIKLTTGEPDTVGRFEKVPMVTLTERREQNV